MQSGFSHSLKIIFIYTLIHASDNERKYLFRFKDTNPIKIFIFSFDPFSLFEHNTLIEFNAFFMNHSVG